MSDIRCTKKLSAFGIKYKSVIMSYIRVRKQKVKESMGTLKIPKKTWENKQRATKYETF